jgi:hypothetical protein
MRFAEHLIKRRRRLHHGQQMFGFATRNREFQMQRPPDFCIFVAHHF